jgi:hypothetical protein
MYKYEYLYMHKTSVYTDQKSTHPGGKRTQIERTQKVGVAL